ncbi:phosphatase PAP2 family protein [Pseudactinotalea suaedae]|uniref:phosphatase PAP2 family protein n=1 Tax=Pseudactinotalea suaedae TaxID=1524924 RepID=UPI001F5003EB|nr:phosphatase PAP2 family protein [Pseudactinotalea suaedae]
MRLGDVDLTAWSGPLGEATAASATTLSRRAGAYSALAVALAVGVAVISAAAAIVIVIYAAVTTSQGVAGLDRPLLDLLLGTRSPVVDTLLTAVTATAGKIGMPLIAITAMVVLGVRRRSWTPVVLIAVTGAVSLLLTITGKEFIARVRPPYSDAVPPFELSESFPSGHTLNAVAVVGIIGYLLALRRGRRARITIVTAAVLYVLLIGFTRVYLGHHWLTDVLAGLVLGAAWLALVITAHRYYLTARSAEREAGPPAEVHTREQHES